MNRKQYLPRFYVMYITMNLCLAAIEKSLKLVALEVMEIVAMIAVVTEEMIAVDAVAIAVNVTVAAEAANAMVIVVDTLVVMIMVVTAAVMLMMIHAYLLLWVNKMVQPYVACLNYFTPKLKLQLVK